MADVQIIHPDLGPDQIITVAEEALPHYHRAGWRLLTDDDTPPAVDEQPPPPMSKAQAAKTAKQATAGSEG